MKQWGNILGRDSMRAVSDRAEIIKYASMQNK